MQTEELKLRALGSDTVKRLMREEEGAALAECTLIFLTRDGRAIIESTGILRPDAMSEYLQHLSRLILQNSGPPPTMN